METATETVTTNTYVESTLNVDHSLQLLACLERASRAADTLQRTFPSQDRRLRDAGSHVSSRLSDVLNELGQMRAILLLHTRIVSEDESVPVMPDVFDMPTTPAVPPVEPEDDDELPDDDDGDEDDDDYDDEDSDEEVND